MSRWHLLRSCTAWHAHDSHAARVLPALAALPGDVLPSTMQSLCEGFLLVLPSLHLHLVVAATVCIPGKEGFLATVASHTMVVGVNVGCVCALLCQICVLHMYMMWQPCITPGSKPVASTVLH